MGFLICGLFRKIRHLFGKYEQRQPSHTNELIVFLHHPLKENVLDAEAAKATVWIQLD